MKLTLLDGAIFGGALILMVYAALYSRRFMRSVADFLAAGRTAGRYIISVSLGMAMLGSITVIGEFEIFYKSGFCLKWWELSMAVAILLVTVSGWVYYRFRQTRALTLAQFFETRYSRRFRVFAGLLAFVSGIINFGIFPSVGTHFFIYYFGIPASFSVFGIKFSTYALLMMLLLALALFFVFAGGQVTVIIADFVQGVFCNAIFVAMIIFFLLTVKWDQIVQALSSVPADASLVNPFRTSQVEDFNFWYFLIGLVGFVYNTMSWQGTQGFNASALSAHESKMAQVLGNWRNFPRNLFLMFIPIVAFTVLHHPDFAALTAKVNSVLGNIDTTEIQSQMRVPLVLKYLLPTGLLGGFAAVMLGAFITTHNSYLHSWGSIFVQDVVMPFRKKPFTPQQHIRLLRGAIAGVAVFIYFFSLIFRQTQHIYLFFAITAAIFVGGSGSVIIGGLYWKRGTTAAAWSAMITGSTIATSGIVLHQIYENFPVNGQWFWGLAMVSSALVYILVSLLGKRKVQDLDKLLHRGKYAIEGEMKVISEAPARGWKVLGMGREFTAGDKFIYVISYAWIIIWTLIFIGGTIYSLSHSIRDSVWMSYWKFYVFIYLAASVIVVIWFTVGGAFDMKAMIRRLRSLKRDERDDGYISS